MSNSRTQSTRITGTSSGHTPRFMRERSDFRRPRNVLICFRSLFQGAISACREGHCHQCAQHDVARIKLPANIHPNNRGVDRHKLAQQQAVLQSDCLWQSCTAHKQCHISLAASHQRSEHSHFRPHCRRLTLYQPKRSPRCSKKTNRRYKACDAGDAKF